jgi:hypothetical protein
VPVRGVDHQHVDAGVDQRARTAQEVATRSHRRRHAQAPVPVLVGRRVLPPLVDVLDRDQPAQRARVVDHRQLLDAMTAHDCLRLIQRRAGRGGHQPLARHRVAQRAVERALELQVAVRDDADDPPVAVDHGHPRDPEALHQRHRLAQRGVGGERDRVEDHPALGALHAVDLRRLAVDRHVLVQHPDAARARHGDRHLALGDGVHRRRHQRDVERDAAREARRGVDVLRVDLGVPRREQDVVERQRHRLAHARQAVRARRRRARAGWPRTRNPAVRRGRTRGAGSWRSAGRHGGR